MDLLLKLAEKNISLTEVLSSFKAGLVIIDEKGDLIYCNPTGATLSGGNAGISNSSEAPRLFNLNQQQSLIKEELPSTQALAGREVSNFKYYLKSEDASAGRFVSVDASPIRHFQGKTLGAVMFYRDITRAVEHERKVLQERSFFLNTLDHFPGSIYIEALDGKVEFINKYFRTNFLKNPGNDLASLAEVFPQEFLDLVKQHNSIVAQERRAVEFKEVLNFPNHPPRHFQTIRFPIYDSDRKISAICSLSLDETEKVEQERLIEAERIKSIHAAKLSALGALSAEIGHEINNPVGVIKTSALVIKQMILDGAPQEEIFRKLEVIDQTTTRMAHIVAGLKNLSRDSSDEQLSACSLQNIIDDVLALCQSKFKIRNVKLSVEPGQIDLLQEINCLRVQVSQVLLNVLINACDAVANLPNAWVKLSISESAECFQIRISDSGPGVPAELREKIFQPFFTTKEVGAGTGLGLSIAKNIMQKQKGDIFLDTESTESCFVIQFAKN